MVGMEDSISSSVSCQLVIAILAVLNERAKTLICRLGVVKTAYICGNT